MTKYREYASLHTRAHLIYAVESRARAPEGAYGVSCASSHRCRRSIIRYTASSYGLAKGLPKHQVKLTYIQ